MEKGKPVKIVTIGGGSSYTPELVEGLINRYDELPVKELWLVDIEEGREKQEIVGNLARRMVKDAGVPMKIFLTLDRREALVDADFVTTQFRVGLLEARIKDERIPLSMGMVGQETNGAGGIFKGLRTIPVILDIVKDIKELCPEAWLCNFTNPSGMNTEAVLNYTDHKKVVGLCNVPIGMHMERANMLNVEMDRVRLEIAGLNHHFFVTDVFLDGISVQDEMIEKCIALGAKVPGGAKGMLSRFSEMMQDRVNESLKGEDEEKDNTITQGMPMMPYSTEYMRTTRAIPCGYIMYYMHSKDMLEVELEEFKHGKTRAEVVKKTEEELFELYKDPNLKEKPAQLMLRGGAYYSDAACNLISSIYNNKCDVQYVNCRNDGAIRDIADNSGVEIAAIITSDGPKPITYGSLPASIRGTILNTKSFEELTCEAAVKGDRNIAITALNVNPLVPCDGLAVEVFDALLEAHKKHLPNFFKNK